MAAILLWKFAEKNHLIRLSYTLTVFSYLLVFSYGEIFAIAYKSIPIPFLGDYLMKTAALGSFAFLLFGAIAMRFLAPPLMLRFANRYSESRLPGQIGPFFVALLIMLFGLYCAFSAGAIYNLRTKLSPATEIVHSAKTGMVGVIIFILDDGIKVLEDDLKNGNKNEK